MMKKTGKLGAVIAFSLVFSLVAPLTLNSGITAKAAKKPALSSKKLNLKVGASKKLTVKNYKQKVTWKSSKASVAKLSSIKKTSVKVTGKKKGSAKVTATYKLNGKNKKLICKVTVKAKSGDSNSDNNGIADTSDVKNNNMTPGPTSSVKTTNSPNGPSTTVDPNATATPTPTFDYDAYSGEDCQWKQPGDKIKDLFKDYFMCGVSTDLGSLRFGERAGLIRYHFNSVTMGNENKMESVVTVGVPDEEESPELFEKYPEGFAKANVDNYYETNGEGKIILDYSTLEKILSYCKANNLKLRYHAFVWHSQVSEYFFFQDFNWSDYDLDDYKEKGWPTSNYHKLCDKQTMVKRLNDYISQVIEYIYSHGYGDVVYAYDVINEATNGDGDNRHTYYVNENATSPDRVATTSGSGTSFRTNGGVRTGRGGKLVTSSSSKEDVEAMVGFEGRVPANDSYWYATMGVDYLYLCFLDAYNAIQTNFEKYKDEFGYKQKPSLIYNDYNSNYSDHIALAKYINKACNLANGTSGVMYCDGIGIQSHGGTAENMIKAIADEGLEVQITELDMGEDGDAQASKLKNLYILYKKYSKNGDYGKSKGGNYKGVTSVTQWGICDAEGSWAGDRLHYMFKQILSDDEIRALEKEEKEIPPFNLEAKPAYYGVLQAGGVQCGTKSY